MAAPVEFNPAKILQQRPWFERAIGAIAPSWEVRRMQARVQRHLFEYQAAQADRLFAPKTYGHPSESLKTERDRKTMMFEARDLVENFGPAKVILNKFAENIAPTEYAPATGDRKYDGLLAEYFHDWCKRCDFEGRHSFRKLVEIAVQTRPVDGDCGEIIRRMADDRLRLQLVAGDRIGSPTEVSTQDNYFSGVTVDQFGRPLSYRIFRVARTGQYLDPEEIPAENFLHYADQFRSDQYRGVTDFHACLRTARMIKDILEAEEVGVKYASQQAALIFNATGTAQNTRDLFTPQGAANMANGQAPLHEESQYGVLKYLQRGDRVEVMPSRPGTAFEGFTQLLMDHFSLGIGVSCGVLFGTKDYKGPSVRSEFAQADRTFTRHKCVVADKLLDPAKEAVILNGIAIEDIPPPTLQAGETMIQALKRSLRGSWRFPAKLTIDVGRESDANINENAIGAKSLQEIAAEQNADAFERLEQNAQVAQWVHELSEKYKVPETAIRLIGKTLPNTPAAAAAAGENIGDAAAAATAAGYGSEGSATAAPKKDEAPPRKPKDNDQEMGRPSVAEAIELGRARRTRPLTALLAKAERLSAIRQRLRMTGRSAAEVRETFERLGVAADAPCTPSADKVVTLAEVRSALNETVEVDRKITELCEGLKARREKHAKIDLLGK